MIGGWFDIYCARRTTDISRVVHRVAHSSFYDAIPGSTRFRAFANSISLSLIAGAHLWRHVGLGFVVAFLLGKLPTQFGIPEGFGDIIAAIFALPLALAVHRKKPVRTQCVKQWSSVVKIDQVKIELNMQNI